jgi:hypothetical protein
MSNLSALLTAQAYERLVAFTERCSFTALANRLPAGNMLAGQLAEVFKEAISVEFEHNLSQQIYVSEPAWQVVIDLKDQQIFIINELAHAISRDAPGQTLVDSIKAFLGADPNASIQPMVLDVLKKEARQHLAKI